MRHLLLLAVVAAVVLAFFAAAVALRPNLTPAERGRRVSEANGCFSCHGPEGGKGTPNPGRADRTVPSFGALMMYANDRDEVREWIRDGVTRGRSASKTWRAQRKKGVLRMPAYGRRLTGREIEDLVTFVLVVSGESAPADSLPSAGLERASALGCFGCHGAGGRLARPNPGSLKGYVPPWDGSDFPELVRGRGEFDEWVKEGIPRRFAADPLPRFFLRRAALHMPAYRVHLEAGDLDAIWAYVVWLRGLPAATPMGP